MKVNKDELVHALETVRPGLASKEYVEQTTSFAFMGDRLVTFNSDISISHPLKGLNITGAIKAEELYKLVSKLPQDEIEMELTESEVLIKAGRSKAGVTLQSEIKLPLEEIGELGEWKDLPSEFINTMSFALFSCMKNTNTDRPALTCVHVRPDGVIESSDALRITHVKIGKIPTKKFLLPFISARELVKYAVNKVAEGDGWIHFKTEDNTIFSCRIYESEFPATEELLKVEGEEIKLPNTLGAIIDKASVFFKRQHVVDEEIELTLSNNRMLIHGKSEFGWFKEECNFRWPKEETVVIKTNPTLLKDILLKPHVKCILGERVIKFEGDNWEHVVCLLAEGD